MKNLLLRKSGAQHHELAAVLWAFVYFFALLASYYVLRPIRDDMGMQAGAQRLQENFTAVFVSMLLLVPVFGWLNRRFARRQLLPWLYAFFVLNLLAFYVAMPANGAPSLLLARVFFVWVSVFNLFAISVFWSFMADLFDTSQAQRLYGFIAAGGTLGALVGPGLTTWLVQPLGARSLLLVSGGFLGLVIVAILRLRAWARHTGGFSPARDSGEHIALGGSLWSGLVDVVRSRYLLGICLFLLCYALLSTFLYFQTADLVPRSIHDSTQRTQLLAQIDLAVNVIALLFQLLAFKRWIAKLGIGFTLSAMPVLSLLGFALLAAQPLLAVLVVFGVLRRAGEYALSKPGRETLFNALPAEQKYKAKNVIDTLVHRTGDTLSAWVYAGLRSLGASGTQISALAVPIAALWWVIALSLGRQAHASGDQTKPT